MDHTVALAGSGNALAAPSCWGSREAAEWFSPDVFEGPASDLLDELTSAYKKHICTLHRPDQNCPKTIWLSLECIFYWWEWGLPKCNNQVCQLHFNHTATSLRNFHSLKIICKCANNGLKSTLSVHKKYNVQKKHRCREKTQNYLEVPGHYARITWFLKLLFCTSLRQCWPTIDTSEAAQPASPQQ